MKVSSGQESSGRYQEVQQSDFVAPAVWGEPVGDPYDFLADAIDENGRSAITLPESIYGALISALLLVHEHTNPLRFVTIIFPILAAVIFTMGMQAYTTWRIWILVEDGGDCESGGDQWLRIICDVVFLMTILSKMREALGTLRWISRFPHASRRRYLLMRRYKSPRLIFDYDSQSEYTTVNKPAVGITLPFRCFVWLLCLFQIILMAMLIYCGSSYILRASDDETLILNSVALVFIVEIDDLVYQFILTITEKNVFSGVPAIALTDGEFSRAFAAAEKLWPIYSPVILAVLVYCQERRWC